MQKNKVGIISINKNTLDLNYGAALHSFAFQKYLDKINIDSVIIDYIFEAINDIYLDYPILSAIKKGWGIRKIIIYLFCLITHKNKYDKIMLFYKEKCRTVDCYGKPFNSKYFNNHKIIDQFEFDTIVCESDIIWSPKRGGFDRAFFCDYEFSSNMRKVSYAASISNTYFNNDEEILFKKLISNFDYVSVRENETANYVQLFLNKPVYQVLDPVLLLDEIDYCRVMDKFRSKRDYILLYAITNDNKMLRKAQNLSNKMNLDIIEISNFWKNRIFHKVYTSLSIGKFLNCFLNAKYIVTNGFHGMCFSIIFKKNFHVFPRDGIDLKIKDLVSLLNINEAFVTNDNELDPIEINYEEVYIKLNECRRKSREFIDLSIIRS